MLWAPFFGFRESGPGFSRARPSNRRPPRRRRAAVKLHLELLEDRTVLSPTWVEQGPASILADSNAPPPGFPAGAVEALAVDPTNADIAYAGAVNGGVWKTTNATAPSPNWTPLTDQQLPALSINSLAISPVNPNTLFAGTGSMSSFNLDGSTGFGLARSTDGGTTWTVHGSTTFADQRIRSVVPTTLAGGQVVLAATLFRFHPPAVSPGGGVYRSTDNGDTFTPISGSAGTGLPAQGVSDLVADPSNPTRFYAAVPLRAGTLVPTGNEGIYRSDDGGLTWAPVSTGLTGLGTARRILLAVHNSPGNDVVYAMIINNSTTDDLQGVFRSSNLGGSWTAMGTPSSPVFTEGQGRIWHGAIVAHPTNPNVVFISGDGSFKDGCSQAAAGTVFRGDASRNNSWDNVFCNGANKTAPHVDSRAMVFDANGNLLEANDGGIFRLVSPDTSATRQWVSVNGNLRTIEFHSVAYDPVSNVVLGGTQDNGTLQQTTAANFTWTESLGGDGGVVAVDSDQTAHPGTSVRYSSAQFFGAFNRQTFDANNVPGPAVMPTLKIVSGDGSGKDLFHFDANIQFYQPFVLNTIDPRRMLIGTENVYESFDRGDSLNDLGFTGVIGGTTIIGQPLWGQPMAYGGRLNGVASPDVFYVGAGPHLLHRVHVGDPITTLSAYPGSNVVGIAMDPQNYQRVYVVDQFNKVWASFDEGASWSDLTANLHALTSDPFGRTIEIFSTPALPNSVLMVGALGGVFEMPQPGAPGAQWSVLGTGLPHALALDLHYNYTDNLLLAGTLGRGAWTLTSPFASGGATNPLVLFVTGPASRTPNGLMVAPSVSPSGALAGASLIASRSAALGAWAGSQSVNDMLFDAMATLVLTSPGQPTLANASAPAILTNTMSPPVAADKIDPTPEQLNAPCWWNRPPTSAVLDQLFADFDAGLTDLAV